MPMITADFRTNRPPEGHFTGQAAARIDVDSIEGAINDWAVPLTTTEQLNSADCIGRVLADDIHSARQVPPFDASAVDGYAVGSDALGFGGISLEVVGTSAPGRSGPSVVPNTAVRIFTGAPVPPGCEAVVMQEHVSVRERQATFAGEIVRGDNIRRAGEDIGIGDLVLAKGCVLRGHHVAVLASMGLDRVSVIRRIKVATVAFGNELVSPGEPIGPHQIYDSNSAMVRTLANDPAVDFCGGLRVGDDPHEAAWAFSSLAGQVDVIFSSGGMSVGDADYTRRALAQAGGSWRLLSLNMKPGKPAGLGRVGDCAVLGLPGNPFAALVCMHLLGKPLLRRLGGAQQPRLWRPARSGFELRRAPGRTEFFPACIAAYDEYGAPVLERLGKGGSARLRPLVEADGIGRIEAATTDVAAGDMLRFESFIALGM